MFAVAGSDCTSWYPRELLWNVRVSVMFAFCVTRAALTLRRRVNGLLSMTVSSITGAREATGIIERTS